MCWSNLIYLHTYIILKYKNFFPRPSLSSFLFRHSLWSFSLAPLFLHHLVRHSLSLELQNLIFLENNNTCSYLVSLNSNSWLWLMSTLLSCWSQYRIIKDDGSWKIQLVHHDMLVLIHVLTLMSIGLVIGSNLYIFECLFMQM